MHRHTDCYDNITSLVEVITVLWTVAVSVQWCSRYGISGINPPAGLLMSTFPNYATFGIVSQRNYSHNHSLKLYMHQAIFCGSGSATPVRELTMTQIS